MEQLCELRTTDLFKMICVDSSHHTALPHNCSVDQKGISKVIKPASRCGRCCDSLSTQQLNSDKLTLRPSPVRVASPLRRFPFCSSLFCSPPRHPSLLLGMCPPPLSHRAQPLVPPQVYTPPLEMTFNLGLCLTPRGDVGVCMFHVNRG